MKKTLKYILLGSVFTASFALAPAAFATEGMLGNGYGARSKALAGAGAADGQDATAAAINPAALARLDSQAQVAVSLFSPTRSTTFGGTTYESEMEYFAIPNLAVNYRVNSAMVDAIGFSVIGAGGMNTDYPGVSLFGAGSTGIDLQQMLISMTLAKKFGNISVGISPTIARQQFEARGIANPVAGVVASGQEDISWGYGLRAGVEVDLTPQFRIGIAGSTKMYMKEFDEFSTLFLDNGDLDLPANLQIGLAYDLTPALTLMADYRYIDYTGVKSIGTPSPQGGFGWKDVQTFKVGVEYDYSDEWTLRAGYAYNTQPLQERDVQINQIAPATPQHHFTAGVKKANFLMPGLDLEIAGMYAPNEKVSGFGLSNPSDPSTAYPIDIEMEQFEITAGLSWKF